jgi:serine/threonine protein kinase
VEHRQYARAAYRPMGQPGRGCGPPPRLRRFGETASRWSEGNSDHAQEAFSTPKIPLTGAFAMIGRRPWPHDVLATLGNRRSASARQDPRELGRDLAMGNLGPHMVTGQRLGAYEVVAKLGEGGMGEVYRATDTTLNRQLAIKVLPDSLARVPTAR